MTKCLLKVFILALPGMKVQYPSNCDKEIFTRDSIGSERCSGLYKDWLLGLFIRVEGH